ncbi:MAG: pyridoxal-5-phosphate-dependent protein subunit beta [Microbacteriaceae bacterium]|nr:pyridoxal-5-phosphate-dependent protein subunit beta [Microbacteriaceae bacterium]
MDEYVPSALITSKDQPVNLAQPYLYDRSGSRYPIDEPRWRGDDGSPLMVSALPGIGRGDIDSAERSQWRYRAALPVPMDSWVSLGEGCTPLLPALVGGVRVRVKPEWFNPTGSFKDRGTSVMMSVLARQGITEMLEDSSGNGGSSVAAYAAAAGIGAKILAPESTSAAKIVQSRMHGATIELVPGNRTATSDEAIRQAETRFYASHNWHPFFLHGIKLLAYEIWEDLGFSAPDNLIVPAGAGSLVLGCFMGFSELVAAGAIERVPRLLVAQPENCSPLASSFSAGMDATVDGEWKPTIAEGTAIARPVRDREVLAAVVGSGGGFQTVREDEIPPAVLALAAQGLYAEPTSSIAAGAVPGFERQGLLAAGDTTVMVLSGSGLKAAKTMADIVDARDAAARHQA